MSPLLPRGGPDRLGCGLLFVIFMKKTLSATRPQDRRAVLSQRRGLKMARSAHAYVRGNTLQFYEWLASATGKLLPQGPPVWICGDCHLGNLGPVADAHGRVKIAIRDLDQTVIGNPAHDLNSARSFASNSDTGIGFTGRDDCADARTDGRRI
jgi:aminoglycoside phosphotransferase (APT) family kinase protein